MIPSGPVASIARTLFVALCLTASSCVVPDLTQLEGERLRTCDAQHLCARGYDCIGGVCRPGTGDGTGPGTDAGADPVPTVCDAQHPCEAGFDCVEDECRQQTTPGGCTAGEKVACDVSNAQCFQGERTCGENGEFGECVASPRPFYEEHELTCDGLDNDCDGRVDLVSDSFSLVAHGAASYDRSWAYVGGGFLSYASDDRNGFSKVYFQPFTSDLQPRGDELFITGTGGVESGHASAVASGASAYFAFEERVDDGRNRIIFARANSDGQLMWPDSNGVPGVARGLTFAVGGESIEGTAIAVTGNQPQSVLAVWRFGASELHGVVYTATDGVAITSNPVGIAVAGGTEQLLDQAALGRDTTFVVAWAMRDGATYTVHLAELNTSLGFVGSGIRSFAVPGPMSSLTLVRNPSSANGFSLYWIEEPSPGQFAVVTVQEPLKQTSSAPVVGPTSEPLSSLQAAHTGSGPLLVWRQGGTQAKLRMQPFGGVAIPVTPPGVSPEGGPSLAMDLAAGRHWIAYDVKQAGSLYFYRTLSCGL